jgi:hypothetical protein
MLSATRTLPGCVHHRPSAVAARRAARLPRWCIERVTWATSALAATPERRARAATLSASAADNSATTTSTTAVIAASLRGGHIRREG